ncbi:hypothetical protein HDU77_008235 [Chytriomyces hyalinus]|nr:hypothetical protein HDU77_008235 [Chytriomyces hyalinus]
MGLSYTPLAIVALDAMESWRAKTESKMMLKAYEKWVDFIESGHITIRYVPTELQVADIMTKALGKHKFDQFRLLNRKLYMSNLTAGTDCAILSAWLPTSPSVTHGNKLTGTIPTELARLTSLTFLILADNQLTGTIPTELGLLTRLTYIMLHNNRLTGTIPTEFGRLTDLEELGLRDNQLTGTIPTEFGQLTLLTALSLYANQLTGSIPAELGRLTRLPSLLLYENQLTGSIPTELGQLTRLPSLDLSRNQLTGKIPTELGKLISLTSLSLYQNQLSGTIPTELGELISLTSLRMDSNNLSGKFPCELTNLKVTIDRFLIPHLYEMRCVNSESSTFAGNQLESTNFDHYSLVQSCSAASLQNVSIPTRSDATAGTKENISGSLDQQQSVAPIIGGVAGGVVLCMVAAILIWYRRKRVKSQPVYRADNMQSNITDDVESVITFPPFSIPPTSAHMPTAEKKAAVPAAFLVANQASLPPEKSRLFDHLEVQPNDRHQAREINPLASLKAGMPERKAFLLKHSVSIVNEKEGSAPAHANLDFAPLSETHGSFLPKASLPDDPNDWTQDEVAQWIIERFGDAELSSLALSKNSWYK